MSLNTKDKYFFEKAKDLEENAKQIGKFNRDVYDDLKDLSDKSHTQNTDQYLDYGGSNQVSASDVKDAVDKKHNSTILGTKEIDESNIGDGKVIEYDSASGKLVYESLPASSDEKVKADSSDPTAGYLDAKVDDSTIKVDTSTHKLYSLGWEVVSNVDISSGTTYVDFTGLSGDYNYRIICSLKTTSVSNVDIELYINGDTTNTNYYYGDIYLNASGSVVGGRANASKMGFISTNEGSLIDCYVRKDPKGRVRWFSLPAYGGSANNYIYPMMLTGATTGTITDITSLRVYSSVTNGIAEGQITLLRLKIS